MLSRRDFLKSSSLLAGSVTVLPHSSVLTAMARPAGHFGVHPFVELHPEAVFIMRTHVDTKTNSEACKRAGLDFGRSVFIAMDNTGIPVTHNIALKPNLTAHSAVDPKRGFTLEDTMGITTDAFFVEGILDSLKELGVAGRRMYARDVNGERVLEPRGYIEMGRRVGAVIGGAKVRIDARDDANDAAAFTWKEVPGGLVHTQIPFLFPFNAPDTWNLNVAKFKAHAMGLTLAAKNWQGANAGPFQGYCRKWQGIESIEKIEKLTARECLQPGVRDSVEASLKQHGASIPRWDVPSVPREDPSYIRQYNYDNLSMELWAHRTIDNHAASALGLHIVEGIYGRDGDFNFGPNPLGSENSREPYAGTPSRNGRAWDYMTNVVIFGKNPYLVDIIGHWLGGHEPGNFGLFHFAMERGKLDMMDPTKIPVYEWLDGVAVRRPLAGFTRTPLRTSYLHRRNANEPLWHLCDEPFDYSRLSEKRLSIPARPTSHLFDHYYPGGGNPLLVIEYSIPERAWALVEILDQSGNNLEVISNAVCDAGYHMAAWNTAKYSAGNYKYRLRCNDYNEVWDFALNKA